MKRPRPGGRTAETRKVVFAAAETLLAEKEAAAISMVEVATHAGVAASSLYRRWGDVRALLTDAAVERLMHEAPLPDTGSLHGDLRTWARTMAASLASPQGSAFFRVAIDAAPRSPAEGASRAHILAPRLEQIAAMLERARARGEAAPSVQEVADYLLAPLYMRALYGRPADEAVADTLVATLLRISCELRGLRSRGTETPR